MFRRYNDAAPLLIGYDPYTELPQDHLARLVELAVEESVDVKDDEVHSGQPKYDPRLCLKVLVYGYATGVRSSRQLEKHCRESLPYLFLTRGDTPSYRTLCGFRTDCTDLLENVWLGLFGVGMSLGLKRLGRIVVDSTKLRANASREMNLGQEEYAAVKQELLKIIAEAEAKDRQEDAEGYAGETRTGKEVNRLQMRDILRKVRRDLARDESSVLDGASADNGDDADSLPSKEAKVITARMRERMEEAVKSIEEAESEGREHLCLTDPDARMMHGGVDKRIRQRHSLEVAIDKDCGLLVADGVTQINNDNERLIPLVEKSQINEPEGVRAVDGDCGYFQSESIAGLRGRGIDTCIPDSTTACELHRGMPVGSLVKRSSVPLEYDPQRDVYLCPEGNVLTRRHPKKTDKEYTRRYQCIRKCTGCPRYDDCVVRVDGEPAKAKYKALRVNLHSAEVSAAMDRFKEPEHHQRYNQRGSFIEGVHGFIRSVLGFDRWLLRGKEKVQCEGKLMTTGYQFRRLHGRWAEAVS